MSYLDAVRFQLKEACHLTGAAWAACLSSPPNAGHFLVSYRLRASCQKRLKAYLSNLRETIWNEGMGSRPKIRWKVFEEFACGQGRLYVFPSANGRVFLLVQAEGLETEALNLWRLVALGLTDEVPAAELIPDLQADIPYNTPRALESVLNSIFGVVPCQAGWLAVRSGELLLVQAQKNCPRCLHSTLSFDGNEFFARLRQSLQPIVLSRGDPGWELLPRRGMTEATSTWAAFPLVVGQRLIGVVTLWRETEFSLSELEHLSNWIARLASTVEIVVTFDEMSNHLRRLAMLNDFALTVSSAQGLEQIVRRVFAMLQRTFRTELVTLFLLSSDARILREYRNQSGGRVGVQSLPVTAGPLAEMVLDGKLLRLDDLPASGYPALHEDSRSALVVPLRYRGQVIGALDLENQEPAAFSVYDEHLMVVIASHLAGLVEYGRLREEAEARARNLGLIHEVVEQVIGLTDTNEVAQIAADLMAQYFAYELAAIALVDKDGQLNIAGIGGQAARVVQAGLHEMNSIRGGGISGRVLRTGVSALVSDVDQDKDYVPITDWEAGSEMCVALKDGERILGIIDVESRHKNAFTSIDLLTLESMAGILAGVITAAEQYQRLQTTIRQLRITQEELQARVEAQRLAESRLVQAAKLAAVGEMAAGIAHELNNPLTTVTGFVDLILQDLPPDDARRPDLEMVLREAHRARSVVRRLLDFSRQSESVRDRIDLNETINETISLMRHLIHTSGVQLHIRLDDSLPWVSADKNQLKQVFVNLFHNALQAMPQGGQMIVETFLSERGGRTWVAAAVSDTGVGIPPQDQERIFEPFFTTKSDRGGTGLGLSVTYGIVTNHGGTIEVESQPEKGSRFIVYLPV
mgnify:CR=1 FL=1